MRKIYQGIFKSTSMTLTLLSTIQIKSEKVWRLCLRHTKLDFQWVLIDQATSGLSVQQGLLQEFNAANVIMEEPSVTQGVVMGNRQEDKL